MLTYCNMYFLKKIKKIVRKKNFWATFFKRGYFFNICSHWLQQISSQFTTYITTQIKYSQKENLKQNRTIIWLGQQRKNSSGKRQQKLADIKKNNGSISIVKMLNNNAFARYIHGAASKQASKLTFIMKNIK